MKTSSEIIEFDVEFSLEELVSALFRSLDGYYDSDSMHCCSELLYAHHLGAAVDPDALTKEIHGSIGYAIEYFRKGRTTIDGWFRQLSKGIFLCSYCGLSEELDEICSWATPRKTIQYYGTLANEIQELHLSLAGLFKPKYAAGFKRLLTKSLGSKKTHVRNLAIVIDAVRNGDQDSFESSIIAAVRNYRKRRKPERDLALLAEWFPIYINTAYFAGLSAGLTPCQFDDNVKAYLCGPFPGVSNYKTCTDAE